MQLIFIGNRTGLYILLLIKISLRFYLIQIDIFRTPNLNRQSRKHMVLRLLKSAHALKVLKQIFIFLPEIQLCQLDILFYSKVRSIKTPAKILYYCMYTPKKRSKLFIRTHLQTSIRIQQNQTS